MRYARKSDHLSLRTSDEWALAQSGSSDFVSTLADG
jgi:hypothetical protein